MKKSKISLIGRIFASISSIIIIILVSGKWLDLYQIPMIFGNSVQHEYTLFEISDFMDTFNMYLKNESISVFSAILSIGAITVILLSAVTLITALMNSPFSKATTILLTISCIILACVFMGAISYINLEMKEATYGGIKELLRGTSNPYWLILFSAIALISVRLKSKTHEISENINAQNGLKFKCVDCGASIEAGVSFCSNCGKKVDDAIGQQKEKFCTSCGAKAASDAAFCTLCGAKIGIDLEQASTIE